MVPINASEIAAFAILAAGAVLHLEITQGVERLREMHTEGRVYVTLMSVWTMAGLLILPPPLIAALIILGYVHSWFRLGRKMVPHRWAFSCSNVIVASAAGGAVLAAAYPQTYPAFPHGPLAFGVVAAATLIRWIINRTLVTTAVTLMRPGRTTFAQQAKPSSNDLIEGGALSLAVIGALVLDADPIFVLVFGIAVLVMHQALTLLQFQSTTRRDPVTGLYDAGFWHEMAATAVERANAQHSTVGVLLIHLDRFVGLTNHHGPSAGDRVLRHVGETLRSTVRKHDLVGRLPAEDFAVLLPDTTISDLNVIAERIRIAIRQLTVQIDGPDNTTATIHGLTASIGGAIYPDHAPDLPGLLLRADANVIAAQYDRGDQSRFPRPARQD